MIDDLATQEDFLLYREKSIEIFGSFENIMEDLTNEIKLDHQTIKDLEKEIQELRADQVRTMNKVDLALIGFAAFVFVMGFMLEMRYQKIKS